VLVVENIPHMAHDLATTLQRFGASYRSMYQFKVTEAHGWDRAVELLQADTYDVVVLDVLLEHDDPEGAHEGLFINRTFALRQQFPPDKPVRILVTFSPTLEDCVVAIREGAWDYIKKEGNYAARVCQSAHAALRYIDTQKACLDAVEKWIGAHMSDLQRKYSAGDLVALWHEPDVHEVGHGRDAFELELSLRSWRWRDSRPYILRVPDQEFSVLPEASDVRG
jgi:CheY-like chemotaxis protein